jgi:hypothetical protein
MTWRVSLLTSLSHLACLRLVTRIAWLCKLEQQYLVHFVDKLAHYRDP